ncbi:MAG: hypothetical protein ACFFDF_13525 [Candidatus Odinarchaeota archaeon]
MLIRRKKEIKRIFFASLIVITICLSNVQILNNFIGFQNEKTKDEINDTLLDKNLQSSNRNIDDLFTNSGVDQDIRVYTTNTSENLQNNENFFDIPSLASRDMFLVNGNFNFTFQNNYTTDYVIEDNSALYTNDFIAFSYDTVKSGITYNDGILISGGWGSIIDNNNLTYAYFNANAGLLNFTISANYTGTYYNNPGAIIGNVLFNRLKILSLIASLDFRVFSNANLTIRIYDNSQSTWIDVISQLTVNSSTGLQRIKTHIINENLNFIDLSNTCYIQVIFERFDHSQFYVRVNGFKMKSTYVFDLPIKNQSYVALEFDLKGDNSTVNGFYAWIRTLDTTKVATTELNISLYRADRTVIRTPTNLRNINMKPNYNEMIDSVIVNGYTGDQLTHFKFNIINTRNLNVSNYFIVIKSNNSDTVYSLVTLPYINFGDDTTEHQLKTTTDAGINWINARLIIPTTTSTYNTGQLDASSFKINVTRGYMPSDFIINSNQTLRIKDIPLENRVISNYPYNESSYLTWGLGQWIHDFPNAILEDPSNFFRVDLTWNHMITKGFKFNVSYSVNAYWIDTALSTYSASYDNVPEWLFKFNLDQNNPSFEYWKLIEFWYVFNDYFTALNVTNPNNQKILPPGDQQSIITEAPNKNKIVVQNDIITLNGFYTLNLTSYNFIHDMHSYINYNGILWESNGFMNGDNISLLADIQDHKNKAPVSSDLNVILYYPNGSEFIELNSSSGVIDDSLLIYDFNNQTILDVTKDLTTFGEYNLGFFWFNGSAIGCKKLPIYIDVYNLDLYNLEYYSLLDKNLLDGEIFKYSLPENYTLLVASINETTGASKPNFYPINNTDLNQLFSYTVGGQDLQVMLTSLLQSEDILNPSETVNVKFTLKNLHQYLPINVIVEVKLVSFINEEWIIAENTSNPVFLDFSGHPNSSFEFSMDLTIPDLDSATNIWPGVNAPIRLGGAKTLITVYIDGPNKMGTYKSPSYSLISNETSSNFDGSILGLRAAKDATRRSIIIDFNRDECKYVPDTSKFLVNIIDHNYISSYQQFTNEFSINLNSKFINITTNPSRPIEGESFILSSILTTEFGLALSGKNVSCQYFDNNIWVDIGSEITDSNGISSFIINTQTIDVEGALLLRLLWEGDIVNGVTKNVSIDIIREINNLSISISPNNVLIYRTRSTTFNIVLRNIGNSILRITNITIELNQDQSYSIVEIDNIKMSWLSVGDITQVIVEVSVKNVNSVVFSISITAENILTNESIIVSKEETYNTFQLPIYDYIVENFIGIVLGFIALIWIVSLLYARHIKKQMETPIEEKPAKKPRRGYVPVAELKKPKPVKKIVKKKEEPKEEEKIDLDSLLEERGLTDEKKESEK